MSRLLPLIVCAAPLLAQSVSVQLSGRVTQKGGAAVASATVVIRNTETGLVRTVQTDANGRYFASTLPVGGYSVTVTKQGFQTAANLKINLNLGDAAPLNVTLATEAATTVEVVAAVANVDSERSSSAAFVSPEALTNLPVLSRSFTSLATLTPQVVVDASRGNLAIAGQRGVNTSVNIDGGDNNEPFFGGAVGAAEGKTPFTISIEAIREYQVVTDGASAEFGRMGGGYVNAITKNGSNDFGGSLFYYTRPQSMVARQPNLNGKPDSNKVGDFKQDQFGFSAGGPIIKDKLFYFVAYDGQRMTSPINMSFGALLATPPVLNPSNAADAVLLAKQGNYDSKANSDSVFLRFDWNLTPDQVIQFRVNHSSFNGDVGSGVTASYENLASDKVTSNAYVVQWNWVVNANWLNEARINYTTDDMPRQPYSTTPEVSITNIGYFGAYPFDRQYNTKRTQLQENLSYVTPTLQIKGGFDYNSIDVSEFFAGNWRGVYSFSSLANYEAGNWTYYRQNFGLNGMAIADAGLFSTKTKQIAAYVQSEWHPTDSLRLGLGLRWDKQQNPDYPIADFSNPTAATLPVTAHIPNDSQFSPRASFTYTPAVDGGKTVVRGSLGRYVSTTPAVFLYQVFAANGLRTGSVDFTPAQAATFGIPIGAAFNPANPKWISSFPAGTPLPKFNIWSFSPDFKNPYTDRVNLAVERGFDALVLGLSGTYAKGNQLERTMDANIGAPQAPVYGRIQYPVDSKGAQVRPNTNYGTMGLYMSDANSLYHPSTLSAKYHKDGSNFESSLYYTYSVNKDTDSNERNYSGITTQDGTKLGNEWSYADTDRRHSLNGYVSYHDTRFSGILASIAVRYLSGFPYSLVYSKDMNHDGLSSNDRYFANGVDSGRNMFRSASNTTMDLALRREFAVTRKVKFTLSADVFNMLNRHDTYQRLSVNGSSTDAAPSLISAPAVVGSARQVQLGARLAF